MEVNQEALRKLMEKERVPQAPDGPRWKSGSRQMFAFTVSMELVSKILDDLLEGRSARYPLLTDFRAASLQFAQLQGVDLSDVVGLTREQIVEAMTDVNTRLPDYLGRRR